MQLTLRPHPDAQPADPPFEVWANLDYAASFGAVGTLNIWFGIKAPSTRFVLPEGESGRADDLWQTTCFEVFLRAEGEQAYCEWNFAPSGQWAAYDFTAYREGRNNAEVKEPYVRVEDNLTWWTLGATIGVETGPSWLLGLSAILEEKDGTKSYWALAHAGGEPDFHDPGCFAARLA
ncbi:MAG TPA: DOMON-like domain-containing protein [Sphingomicrobium sp.]|nr:DOMON-like domain-containing protein [Sphingomicrobium sp.]